jgi:hypothetical protein
MGTDEYRWVWVLIGIFIRRRRLGEEDLSEVEDSDEIERMEWKRRGQEARLCSLLINGEDGDSVANQCMRGIAPVIKEIKEIKRWIRRMIAQSNRGARRPSTEQTISGPSKN